MYDIIQEKLYAFPWNIGYKIFVVKENELYLENYFKPSYICGKLRDKKILLTLQKSDDLMNDLTNEKNFPKSLSLQLNNSIQCQARFKYLPSKKNKNLTEMLIQKRNDFFQKMLPNLHALSDEPPIMNWGFNCFQCDRRGDKKLLIAEGSIIV